MHQREAGRRPTRWVFVAAIFAPLIPFMMAVHGAPLQQATTRAAGVPESQFFEVAPVGSLPDPAYDWQEPAYTVSCHHTELFNEQRRSTCINPDAKEADQRYVDELNQRALAKVKSRQRRSIVVSDGGDRHDGIVYQTNGGFKTTFSQAKPNRKWITAIKKRPTKSRSIFTPFGADVISPQRGQHGFTLRDSAIQTLNRPSDSQPEVDIMAEQNKNITKAQLDPKTVQLLYDDVNLSDRITVKEIGVALNSVNYNRQVAARIVNRMDGIQPGIAKEGREHNNWLPQLQTLRAGAGQFDSRSLLNNMSHYLQYFSVGLEQMVFDEWSNPLSKEDSMLEDMKVVERSARKMICDLIMLIRRFDEMAKYRAQYNQMRYNYTMTAESEAQLRKMMDEIRIRFDRLNYRGEQLYSPYWLQQSKLIKVVPIMTRQLVYVGREVMPINERKLDTMNIRAVRDRWILAEFMKFMDHSEHLLREFYRQTDGKN